MALGVYCKTVTISAHTRFLKTGPFGGGRSIRVRGHRRKMCWRNDGRFAIRRRRRN